MHIFARAHYRAGTESKNRKFILIRRKVNFCRLRKKKNTLMSRINVQPLINDLESLTFIMFLIEIIHSKSMHFIKILDSKCTGIEYHDALYITDGQLTIFLYHCIEW